MRLYITKGDLAFVYHHGVAVYCYIRLRFDDIQFYRIDDMHDFIVMISTHSRDNSDCSILIVFDFYAKEKLAVLKNELQTLQKELRAEGRRDKGGLMLW